MAVGAWYRHGAGRGSASITLPALCRKCPSAEGSCLRDVRVLASRASGPEPSPATVLGIAGLLCPGPSRLICTAVDGVEVSPELLAAINDINTQVRFVRVFHVQHQVLVETEIAGDAIEPSGFYTACEAVATVTDRVGPRLAAEHGGRTAFENSKEDGYRPREELIGMYL